LALAGFACWCGVVQCLWRCYAADPRSQFSATWVAHVRAQPGAGAAAAGSHVAAAGHTIVRSFSRVARRASVSLVRLRRASTKNSCSPDAPSSSSAAAAAAADTRRAGDIAADVLLADCDAAHSGLLLSYPSNK